MIYHVVICVGAMLVMLSVGPTSAEVFTSMAEMESLLYLEKDVVSIVDAYIATEKERLKRLKEFAEEYQTKNQQAARDGSQYLANPVNAYLMVRRLTADWGQVEFLMRQNAAEGFLQNVTRQREFNQVKFPGTDDLNGAAVALLRLQDTYKLSTGDMADGNIAGTKRADELSAFDCYELGKHAYNNNDFYHTLLWMQEAYDRNELESPATVDKVEVLEYLGFSMFKQGNMKRAFELTKILVELAPDHPRGEGNLKFYSEQIEKNEPQFERGDSGVGLPPVTNERSDDGGVPERERYEALCRGELQSINYVNPKVYCQYKKEGHHFLTLAPLKEEIVHWKPKISIFRQVISDAEIETVKEFATPRLARATVQNSETGELEVAHYRISKSAWLKPQEHDNLEILNKRMGLATNLNMDTAEDIQVANYGIGGHYDPHYDFARKEEKNAFKGLNTGNRIATFLGYMSTPEAGGATVFPELGVSLFPTKNDAVFWFNLLKNGEGDMTTRHAACPVLAGVKWVCNRWIHEKGQDVVRPCAIDEHEYE